MLLANALVAVVQQDPWWALVWGIAGIYLLAVGLALKY